MTEYADIRLLVMDVDGVMTDGKITYTGDGQELKSFNIKDGLGIKRAQAMGIETAIITGRTSPMVERRARELGIAHLVQGRDCLLYPSPSPRDMRRSRMPSSA